MRRLRHAMKKVIRYEGQGRGKWEDCQNKIAATAQSARPKLCNHTSVSLQRTGHSPGIPRGPPKVTLGKHKTYAGFPPGIPGSPPTCVPVPGYTLDTIA